MRKPAILFAFALFTAIGLIFSAFKNKEIDSAGLKDYYKKYFPIGVAVAPFDLTGDHKNLILNQVNSITSENAIDSSA